MPQIFPKALNPIARVIVLGLPMLAGTAGVTGGRVLPVDVRHRHGRDAAAAGRVQPRAPRRPARHRLPVLPHLGRERPGFANIPPTKTCMNCHQQIWQGADMLEPVREQLQERHADRLEPGPQPAALRVLQPLDPRRQGRRLRESCHGRIDQMNLTFQTQHAADGVVHRLPPRAGEAPPAEVRGLQHDLQPRQQVGRQARGLVAGGLPAQRRHADGRLNPLIGQTGRRPEGTRAAAEGRSTRSATRSR